MENKRGKEDQREKNKISVNVLITRSFSDEESNFKDIAISYDGETITLNDILKKVQSSLPGYNFSLSYFENDLNSFVFCGVYPLQSTVHIPINVLTSTPTIQIKLRPIIHKDKLMRMDMIEEDTENIEESNENNFISIKSKRAKERKIGLIIQKVYMWRKLYNGYTDENGKLIKLTLEDAADKVGISKKSLDDYLIQLRIGRTYGFNFNEHKNDKVGVLRAFVKKSKCQDEAGNQSIEHLDD